MAERTFCQEPTRWSRSRAVDLHHDSGARGWRAKRRRLCARNSVERFDDRVLRSNPISRSYHGAVFWTANRERVCGGGSACCLLSTHAGRNLPACTRVTEQDSAQISQKTPLVGISQ